MRSVKVSGSTTLTKSSLVFRTPTRNTLRSFKSSKCRFRPEFLDSVRCISVGVSQLSLSNRKKSSCPRDRKVVNVKALVAFDYTQPALWLGVALISGGILLYNLRNVQPVSAKDSDIVLSSILVFSGGILVFQGWRLDPLLLFVQICTAGSAFTWALESINLRKDLNEQLDTRSRALPEDSRRRDRASEGATYTLPAPDDSKYGQWYGNAESKTDFEEQPPASGRGFYDGRGQEVYYQPAQEYYDERGVQERGSNEPGGRGQEVYYQPAQEYYDERGVQERGFNEPGRGYDEQGQGSEGVYYQSGNAGPSYYDKGSEREYPQNYQGRDPRGYEGTTDRYYPGDEGRAIRGQQEYAGAWDQEQRAEGVGYAEEGEGISKQAGTWDQEQRGEGVGYAEEGEGVSKQAGSGTSSRVVDEVENYYKRPESVVEDVERFYDSQGRLIYSPEDRDDQRSSDEQYWTGGGSGNASASGPPEADQSSQRQFYNGGNMQPKGEADP